MLNRDLGQQQAAAPVPADEETMAADLDLFGLNRLRRRQNAQLNFEMRSFLFGNRREAVVVESGGASGFRHGPVDRASGNYIAHASAQLFVAAITAQIERSENPAMFGKVSSRGLERKLELLQRGSNGIVRQAKQQGALFAGEFLAGSRAGCGFAAFRFGCF